MRLLIAFCILFALNNLCAQTPWKPSPGHKETLIWPGTPPDAQPVTGPENMRLAGPNSLVAGKPWFAVERVSQPTMTVYSPQQKNTGAAVIVFPGGGFERFLPLISKGRRLVIGSCPEELRACF